MGNAPARGSLLESCSSYDEAVVNRGTLSRPRPLLKFHSVHGENVQLLNEGSIARRKESFCKALAFSNRPISVDEIVCLSLCEVGTNWSGVLRFGVTNIDPASFRDIELPKFVCPDLTSKPGYWAKALAERYSTSKAILHFFINADGELHYGINGIGKGLFLSGINVALPLWIIVDIYGNSVAVEFIDSCVVELRSLSKVLRSQNTKIFDKRRPHSLTNAVDDHRNQNDTLNASEMMASTSASNLINLEASIATNRQNSYSVHDSSTDSPLRFHSVKGINITLNNNDLSAIRRHGEYNLGYVFTNRPIRIDETISIVVSQYEEAFTGSLAFGLTSCDPVNVPASSLPVDSDDLLERPEYWVCVKDVGAEPRAEDRLTFKIDKEDNAFTWRSNALTPRNGRNHRALSEGAFGATWRPNALIPQPLILSNEDHSSAGTLPIMHRQQTTLFPNEFGTRILSDRPSHNLRMEHLRVALPPTSENSNSENSTNQTSGSDGSLRTAIQSRFIPIPRNNEAGVSSVSSSASSSEHDLDSALSSDVIRTRTDVPHNNRRPRTTPNIESTNQSSSLSSAVSSSPLTTPISSGNALLGDDFDLMAARYSSLLSSRRLDQGTSYSASPCLRNDSNINRNDVSSISPTTSSFATPISYRSVLTEALQCLNNASSHNTSTNSTDTSLFSQFNDRTRSDMNNSTTLKPTAKNSGTDNALDGGANSECSICMNSRVNAVIYRCGHMCMCFSCAKELNRRSGDCPICRTPIIDVIRCYPA